jgi:hypothetical protein
LGLIGRRCGDATMLCSMYRQALRDWIIRYNAESVAGLFDRTSPGLKPPLTPEQEAAVGELVSQRRRLCHGVVRCAGAGWIWPA